MIHIYKNTKKIIQNRYLDRQPLAFVHSYGCQLNVSDGEKICGILAEIGYGFCTDVKDADFILYNTCAIRENAENRIYGNVGILKEYKQQKKGLIIALCGCMMQQPHAAEKIKKSFPYVDLVFGTHTLHTLPEMIGEIITKRKRLFNTDEKDGKIIEDLPIRRDSTEKAWVPVMYGCDNYCSYCIVPYVRGRERSRRSQDIITEVADLAKKGYKTITLLGQNVNSYLCPDSADKTKCDFPLLLRKLNAIDGDFTLDFMTSHPKDAGESFIDAIADCEKVRRHIHLPVQSGSDRILKAMNRKYTIKDYLNSIDYARFRIPEITFSSDIIVGFPGEEYEDFLLTLELIKRVRYKSLFTFIFSKREGTAAAKLEDKISKEEKTKWFLEMLEIQKEIESNF